MSRLPGYGVINSWWVPAASVTAFPTVTAASLSAGTELTKYELPDSKVGLGAPSTVSESAQGDLALTDTPTFATYNGSLHLFRSYGVGGVPASDDLLSVFAGRPFGYYFRRVGLPNTTAPAAAQIVEGYLFQASDITIEAETAMLIKLLIPMHQQGVYKLVIPLT